MSAARRPSSVSACALVSLSTAIVLKSLPLIAAPHARAGPGAAIAARNNPSRRPGKPQGVCCPRLVDRIASGLHDVVEQDQVLGPPSVDGGGGPSGLTGFQVGCVSSGG